MCLYFLSVTTEEQLVKNNIRQIMKEKMYSRLICPKIKEILKKIK
jgi:hypothetical protein